MSVRQTMTDGEDSQFEVESIGGEVEIENMEPGNHGNSSENPLVSAEEDIYGDLDAIVFSSASKNKAVPRDVLEGRLSAAGKEIAELKERITKLSTENLNLMNNFSSLLKTAREDKEKNIFTLRELRNQLRHVTNLNAQRSSLSKEEVEKIHAYCNDVEGQLQSQISIQLIRQALETAKREHVEIKKSAYKRKWSKQFKFDNMSIYLCKEQIPFTRSEPVTFPLKTPPVSIEVQTEPQKSREPLIQNGRGAPAEIINSKKAEEVPEGEKQKIPEEALRQENPQGSRAQENGRRRDSEPQMSLLIKPYNDGAPRRKSSVQSGRRENTRDFSAPRMSERLGHPRRKSRSISKEPPAPSRSNTKRPRRTRSPSPPSRRARRSDSYRRRH